MRSIESTPVGNHTHERLDDPEVVDYEARVLDLLQPSVELEKRLRPLIDTIIEQAQATSINPQAAKNTYLTGEITKWELFGRIGEPLPPGLVYSDGYYQQDGPQADITCDGRDHFCETCKKETVDRFNELGLKDIVDQVEQDIRSRELPIHEALRAAIKQTATYQLIQSLNVTPPIAKQRPLNNIEIQSRQQANHYSMLNKYSASRIDPMTAAFRELWKLNMALDDVTIPGKVEAPEVNAYERVYKYFLTIMQKSMSYQEPVYVHNITPSNDPEEISLARVQYSTSQDNAAPLEETTLDIATCGVAVDTAYENHGQIRNLNFVAEWYFTKKFLDQLYGSLETNLDTIIDDSIEETASHIYEWGLHLLGRDYTEGEFFRAYSRRPPGNFAHAYEIEKPAHENWHRISPREFGFTVEDSEKKIIGNIIRYKETQPNTRRIILAQGFDLNVPYAYPNEDLIINLSSEYFGDEQDPFIPGFILTSRNRQRYGFIYDSNADPYTPPNYALTDEQLQQIKNMHASIDLDDLVNQVGDSITSVEEWVKGLSDNTIYPELKTDDDQGFSLLAKWDTLKDFKPFIIDKKLYVQCNGSSRIFQLSFEDVFGKGSADIVGGLTLMPEITSTTHAQVVITLNNRLHIVDPSASLPDEDSTDSSEQEQEENTYQISQPPPPSLPERPVAPYHENSELDTTEFHKEQLALINSSLEAQLRNVLNVRNNDELFKIVATLPSHDPIRRTLAQVRRAIQQQETIDAVSENLTYLTSYRNADSSLRQKIGLSDYEAELVSGLQSSVKRLMVITERAPELFAPSNSSLAN